VLDKSCLKPILERAGIKTDRDRLLTRSDDARRLAHELGFPIVLKPLNGSGGLATWCIRSAVQLKLALDLMQPSLASPVLDPKGTSSMKMATVEATPPVFAPRNVMRVTPAGWQWSKSGREGWAFLNTLTQPISQLGFGHFVSLTLTDVVRATGSEWQISKGGTSPWGTLYKTTAPLSSAVFGDFEGDDHTDAFFADGTQWSIVQSFSPRVTRHYTQPYKLTELRFGNFVGDAKVDVLRSTGSEWLVWDHLSKTWSHLNFSSIPQLFGTAQSGAG